MQEILDAHCLVGVEINPESRVKSTQGPAQPRLVQNGWSVFLVKVNNQAGVTAELVAESPNAAPLYRQSTGRAEPKASIRPADVVQRWADVVMYRDRPLKRFLSGLSLEYRIVQIYSRDAGKREARISFNVGQGTPGPGFSQRRRHPLQLRTGRGRGRRRSRRGRPADDGLIHFSRPHGASLSLAQPPARARFLLPPPGLPPERRDRSCCPRARTRSKSAEGRNTSCSRGRSPSPRRRHFNSRFSSSAGSTWPRWAWYSGDHHVHAAGCGHYESPTEGVTPEDMWRHILGEDLDVGCVLSWGPCWYAQKHFFEGKIHPLSTRDYLMRYDIEVSGFPSSHAGHLCLLRLKEDDYPGTTRIEEWPSWDLPVLKWGKSQGGVVGFSHSGWGLKTSDDKLPTYDVPPFDGIGANEYIVDVVHDAVDFISTVDTPAPWELNIWYHTLNCGYRTKISGETDFPCIYGERVGLGRVYVKLPDGQLDFDQWCEGVKLGRSYVSDGKSHLIDFQVNDRAPGEVRQRAEAR